MSEMSKRWRLVAAAGAAVVALFAAGCGGDEGGSGSSGGEEKPAVAADSSKDKYATVLDEQVAATEENLDARTIDVGGGHEIAFEDGEQLKIAFAGFGKLFDYSIPEYDAADAMKEEFGVSIDSFDPAGDPQKGVAQIQDAMNSGKYNALVVYPLSTDLYCDLLTEQAPKKGLLVALVGQPACTDEEESPGVLTTVPDTGTLDVYQAWADAIVKDMGSDGGKAILMAGPKLDHLSQLAVKAVTEKAKAAGNIEIVSTIYTDYTQPDALQKVQDQLQAHGDVDSIISMFPEGTQAANTAVKVSGKEIALYDFGTNEHGMKNIESGAVKVSVPYYPYSKVKTAIQAMVIARRGGEVPKYMRYSGHAPESIRPSDSEVMIVTPENVKEFQQKVAEY